MKICHTVDLGFIGYAEGFALQSRIVAVRKAGTIDDVLLFCEHPPVLTLGRNGKRENLLASEHVLKQKGVEFYESDRGGDITYHGPGQIVGYPIIHLAEIRRDVHWYVRMLEELMIRTSAEFGVNAFRVAGRSGIWVQQASTEEKLAAIGVHLSRWITSHGFAYNVSTDLRNFELIVPCGITDRKATSLEKLLERAVQKTEVQPKLAQHFGDVFGFAAKFMPRKEFLEQLQRAEKMSHVPA